MREEIIKSCHNYKTTGHYKEMTTFSRIATIFHLKGMRPDISTYIKRCIQCSLGQDDHRLRDSRHATRENSVLNNAIHIDLSGPWKKYAKLNIYVVVIIEVSTRFTLLIPV